MYIRCFFAVLFLGLSILPLLNISFEKVNLSKLESVKPLYNIDLLEGVYNHFLLSIGISSNPDKVVLGSEGWMFLGDKYNKTITYNRNGSRSQGIKKSSKQVINAQTQWDYAFKQLGVKQYSVMIGPNKSTVYAKFMPLWAQSKTSSISQYLYGSELYIDSRQDLIQESAKHPVYRKTDTHWTTYGAGVAFNNYMQTLANTGVKLPPKSWGEIVSVKSSDGGDLARFLKVDESYHDIGVKTQVSNLNLQHKIYDVNKRKLVYKGTKSLHGKMSRLSLIKTEKALNNKKLLWLSDSFGDSLAPYITATFSDVMKQHWSKLVGKEELLTLVKNWQPDYVLITTVERTSLSKHFKKHPKIKLVKDLKLTNLSLKKATLED